MINKKGELLEGLSSNFFAVKKGRVFTAEDEVLKGSIREIVIDEIKKNQIPLELKPILISIALLDFVWTIQVFAVLWMLTGGGPVNTTTTLSVYIYKKVFYGSEYAIASTAAVIVLVLCSVVAFIYARYQNSLKR